MCESQPPWRDDTLRLMAHDLTVMTRNKTPVPPPFARCAPPWGPAAHPIDWHILCSDQEP